MGNSKNKKVPNKRRASNKSKCTTSSDQKENVPKNEKTRAIKPKPNDSIAMSKQLLLKKNNARTQRRSSSKPERMCSNGKPLPSLSELEKMYEDSDDDDQLSKTPTQKPTCTTSTPEKQTPKSINEKNLLSPSTINKISERIMGSIQQHNFPDTSELIEATSLLREKSPPPPPIIPPKKRKKPEVPYIVGCKDRPKVIRKPNTNFCKGDDDYGVEASSEDPEEQTPTKRAKKSRIPNYSKSIFNAHSDEIAERLTKDDAGGLSDASSDSNKTIEYYPTLFHNSKIHSFSPLPSTSTDNETFRKNDELFNESLKEINVNKESTPKTKEDDLPMIELSTPKKKEYDFLITKEPTPKKKEGDFLITKEPTPKKKEGDFLITKEPTLKKKDDFLITNQLTPKKQDGILIAKQSTPKKKEDDVQIIDIPYDTIVIEDIFEKTVGKQHTSNSIDTNVIEIIEPEESEVVTPKEEPIIYKMSDDEDCMIVPSSKIIKNHNNFKLNEPIVIDDEYSTINMECDSFNNEPIEIIDVDNVIAENKSILEKFKNFGAEQLNKINTVVDVPTTYKIVTVAPQATVIPSTTVQTTVKPSTTQQASVTPSSTLQTSVTPSSTLLASVTPSTTLQTTSTLSSTLQASVTPTTTLQTTSTTNPNNDLNITNRNKATNSRNNQRQPTSVSNTQTNLTFKNILDDFFESRHDKSRGTTIALDFANGIAALFSKIGNRRSRPTSNSNEKSSQSVNNAIPVSINAFQNASNRQRFDLVESSSSLSHTGTQQPSTTIPPVPSRNIGDCPICLDPLHSSNGIASTICGHVFCLKCIQASVKTNGKKCPTCRKALKGAGGGYHQLYL